MRKENMKRTVYNKVVNIDKETNEITMLDSVFVYNDGFKGAVGSIFQPISKEQLKDEIKKCNVMERILSIEEMTKTRANNIYKEARNLNDLESIMFDLSYKENWDELRQYGYNEKDYPVFNCIGGGRCFEKTFKGNINKELSKIIRDYEK